MTKEKQITILEEFYQSCLRFWERENVENPKMNALEDVYRITTNPFQPYNAEPLDEGIKHHFILSKL